MRYLQLTTTTSSDFHNCPHLSIDLRGVPFATAVLPLITFSVTYFLYHQQGRWCNYLPTISETGTEWPNNIIFMFLFPALGIGAYYTMKCISRYLRENYPINKKENTFLRVTRFIGALGLSLIGFFPLNIKYVYHLASAGSGIFSIFLYECYVYYIAGHKSSLKDLILRGVLLVIQAIGGFFFAIATDILPYRISTTMSAIGEISCVVSMLLFFLSFTQQIAQLKVAIRRI